MSDIARCLFHSPSRFFVIAKYDVWENLGIKLMGSWVPARYMHTKAAFRVLSIALKQLLFTEKAQGLLQRWAGCSTQLWKGLIFSL